MLPRWETGAAGPFFTGKRHRDWILNRRQGELREWGDGSCDKAGFVIRKRTQEVAKEKAYSRQPEEGAILNDPIAKPGTSR